MQFEWDEQKERRNLVKHGVDFGTAALVFNDEHRIEFYDEEHSFDEDRFVTIGSIAGMITVLMVVYTERGEVTRIISARKATSREKTKYYAGIEEY